MQDWEKKFDSLLRKTVEFLFPQILVFLLQSHIFSCILYT